MQFLNGVRRLVHWRLNVVITFWGVRSHLKNVLSLCLRVVDRKKETHLTPVLLIYCKNYTRLGARPFSHRESQRSRRCPGTTVSVMHSPECPLPVDNRIHQMVS